MSARYAIYFAPPRAGALWRFGSAAIGYDAESGETPALALKRFDPESWAAATAEPRRYGFHGTLKAPFRLAAGRSEAELAAACAAFAGARVSFACAGLELKAIGRFLALTPIHPCAALDRLAGACVETFEPFRAPLSTAETERRLRAPLTERQKDNLARWGYPYVFEDFRFHMTLTGPLDEETRSRAQAELAGHFVASTADGPLIVPGIALFRQEEGGPFRLVARYPFGGGA